ncbi:MAG: M16 family metallopeptidase, partial [Pyrinomonadaceae bacterium]
MNQTWSIIMPGIPNKTQMQKLFYRLRLTTSLFLLLLTVPLSEPATSFPQRAARQSPSRQSKQESKQSLLKEVNPSLAPPLRLSKKVLANGLEVVVFEDHSVPLVTVEMAVKNGSYTEPPELNGLSHLYEHMFFKANRATAGRESYLAKIDQQGISYNGTTREEIVEYYFTSINQNLRTALNLMRDAIRYPLFDKNEFERERQVVISEIDRNESNPFYYLNKEMNDRLFYKYPSRKNPLGGRETVSSATTDQMRLIQGRYYVPNNSALVVAGDATPDGVFQMAQEY